MHPAGTLRERKIYASHCDYETQKRYAEACGGDMQKAANPDNWQVIENRRIIKKDYPTKYGALYPRYFFQEVFNGDIRSVWHWLDEQFPQPDRIDFEYINILIEEAKEYGFFIDGWVCVMLGYGATAYHDNIEESRSMAVFSNADSRDRFYGGRIYRARRKHIRNWVKERLSTANHRIVASTSDCSEVPEIAGHEIVGIEFQKGFTAERADQVAEFVGITEDGCFALKEKDKSAITGFIEGLKEHGVLTYPSLPVAHSFFGARYGVKVKTDRVTKIRTDYQRKTLKGVQRLFPLDKARI